MSILPFLMDELSRPIMYDQNFGLGLLDDDLLIGPYQYGRSRCPILLKSYIRPHRLTSAAQSGLSCIQNDKNNFKVDLDVKQFKPEEVSVKVADGCIVVDGKHEERSDEHGYISRQFTRRYKMPDNVDTNAITSTLSSDGVLSIGAPKKIPEKCAEERPIQVVQTNQPSNKQSSNKDKENNESMKTKNQ